MADTSLGFRFKRRKSGGEPHYMDLLHATTETLSKGDLVNLETGEIDLAVSSDSAMLGAVQETGAGTASTTRKRVIVDADAIYEVYDPVARLKGATLDISGATGAMTITTSGDADLTVWAESTASEPTLVFITHGEHADN